MKSKISVNWLIIRQLRYLNATGRIGIFKKRSRRASMSCNSSQFISQSRIIASQSRLCLKVHIFLISLQRKTHITRKSTLFTAGFHSDTLIYTNRRNSTLKKYHRSWRAKISLTFLPSSERLSIRNLSAKGSSFPSPGSSNIVLQQLINFFPGSFVNTNIPYFSGVKSQDWSLDRWSTNLKGGVYLAFVNAKRQTIHWDTLSQKRFWDGESFGIDGIIFPAEHK